MRRRLFFRWAIVLAVVWITANWPSRFGIAGFFYHGGFPLTYAIGAGRDVDFYWMAFIGNCLIGLLVVLGLSWLCVWSRFQESILGR
jgi:hypothetical protein